MQDLESMALDAPSGETTTEDVCARPGCGTTFEIVPGHRPRKYCGDACKQLAYLQRREQKKLEARAAKEQAQYERDVALLRKCYGLEAFSPEIIDKLLQLRRQYGTALTDELGGMLSQALAEARKTYNQSMNELRDEIMLLGERLNFVSIAGPHEWRLSGVEQYCEAVGQAATLEDLQVIRDAAHMALRGRQRMAAISAALDAKYSNRHTASS